MKTRLLVLILCVAAVAALAQRPEKSRLKKLSQFPTEKERCTYIFELVNSHVIDFAVPWKDVKPICDLYLIEETRNPRNGFALAGLSDKWPEERIKESRRHPELQVQMTNWYVFFEIRQGKIVRYYVSNCGR